MSLTLLEAAKAKLEGKRVEYQTDFDSNEWIEWKGEGWYEEWTFRIAPTTKKVRFLCWQDGYELFWRRSDTSKGSAWKRIPELDKEVEVTE